MSRRNFIKEELLELNDRLAVRNKNKRRQMQCHVLNLDDSKNDAFLGVNE